MVRKARFNLPGHDKGDATLEIVALGPRERIYEETLRLVKKG